MYEVKPSLGDFVTIIQYQVPKDIYPFALIGFKRIVGYNNNYTNSFRDHFNTTERDIMLLDECLGEAFLKDHSEEAPIYNLTNAVFKSYTYEPIGDFPQIMGVLYPSVKSYELNFAFLPDLVKPFLNPYKVERFRIVGEDPLKFTAEKTHQSKIMTWDGEIHWSKYPYPYTIDIHKIF